MGLNDTVVVGNAKQLNGPKRRRQQDGRISYLVQFVPKLLAEKGAYLARTKIFPSGQIETIEKRFLLVIADDNLPSYPSAPLTIKCKVLQFSLPPINNPVSIMGAFLSPMQSQWLGLTLDNPLACRPTVDLLYSAISRLVKKHNNPTVPPLPRRPSSSLRRFLGLKTYFESRNDKLSRDQQ